MEMWFQRCSGSKRCDVKKNRDAVFPTVIENGAGEVCRYRHADEQQQQPATCKPQCSILARPGLRSFRSGRQRGVAGATVFWSGACPG